MTENEKKKRLKHQKAISNLKVTALNEIYKISLGKFDFKLYKGSSYPDIYSGEYEDISVEKERLKEIENTLYKLSKDLKAANKRLNMSLKSLNL